LPQKNEKMACVNKTAYTLSKVKGKRGYYVKARRVKTETLLP